MHGARRAEAVRLAEQRRTLLGLAERLRPGAAEETALADAVRAESEASVEAASQARDDALAEAARRREAVTAELGSGYTGIVAEGRAAMRLAGKDPDDPEATMAFNAAAGAA